MKESAWKTIHFSFSQIVKHCVTKFKINGAEGWVGENSSFGTLEREGNVTYLWHHLGVHERDSVTFGIYQIKG